MKNLKNIKKATLTLGCFFILTVSFAQNSNKKKVLVVPHNRFQFQTEFDIKEIAAKNNITSSEVFLHYEKALLDVFENYEDDNFEFIPIAINEARKYKKFIQYKAGSFNGKNYNAVDLSNFSETNFTTLLTHYQADFILFITWYDIQKKRHLKTGIKRDKVRYAAHFLDFDVYNLFRHHVIGLAKVQAEAPAPTNSEASFSLLRIQEVKMAYDNFAGKVIEQLNQPIKLK